MASRHRLAGFAASCWTQDIENFGPDFLKGYRDAYSFCSQFVARSLGEWLRERWPSGCGGVAYIFETGDKNSGEATAAIAQPHNRSLYKHVSHAFIPKNDAPPLWAADLLAWEWAKYWSESVATKKRPMRASLRALLTHDAEAPVWPLPYYRLRHFGGDHLVKFLKYVGDIALAKTEAEMDALFEGYGLSPEDLRRQAAPDNEPL